VCLFEGGLPWTQALMPASLAPPDPGAYLFEDGLCWTDLEVELNTSDNSVMGIPSVHGGTAYPAAKAAEAGKDVAADAKV
jgi:hypothetical protein